MDFLRLLRLGERARRKEQSAKRKAGQANGFDFFTIACCLLPNACSHLITMPAVLLLLVGGCPTESTRAPKPPLLFPCLSL
jgi:hypothetical protein